MIKEYLRVSRPQLWLYIIGSFFVGAVASDTTDLFWPALAVFAFYFIFPANVLLYGLNYVSDLFKYKQPANKDPLADDELSPWRLINVIVLWNLPFTVVWLADEMPTASKYALVGFLFFAVFYSMLPIRAKTKPILDVLFSVVYIFPGLFAYGLLEYKLPSWQVVTAASLWWIGLSAYLLIPRSQAARQAGVSTTATFLRPIGTILFCILCFAGAGFLAYPLLGKFALGAAALYIFMMIVTFVRTDPEEPFIFYKLTPIIAILTILSLITYVMVIVK